MARKKWSPESEVTPSLFKFREKRKWQINLRRYVIEKSSCPFYAPYFGLDIENLRKWFEIQFENGVNWEDFGKKWQFDHIIPVTYFDFEDEQELKMCWNFINLRIAIFQGGKDQGNRVDLLVSRQYFENLYKKTLYKPCMDLLEKISRIEGSGLLNTNKQEAFLMENRPYLDMIETYSRFEFELLNSGRTIEEVRKEIDFLKKF